MFAGYISKRDPRRPEIRVGTGHPDGTTFFAIKKLVEGWECLLSHPATHRGWIIKQEALGHSLIEKREAPAPGPSSSY